MQNPCLAYWSEDWSARQCFNFKSALLGWSPLPFSPFHFAEKVSSSSPMPRWCPGKVRAKSELSPSRPQDREHLATCLVGSPGAQHLWTDWLPLRKKKPPTLLPLCHFLPCVQTWSTSKKHMHLPPLHILIKPYTPFPECPSYAPPPSILPSLPLSLPVVNFADEIKQTNFHWCVRSGALDRVAKRKNQCSPKLEIKLNM